MLESLTVKNLALIREARLEFGKGLNILTGETGAGKSILIGSVNYALGAKVNADVIRTGAEQALVEIVFHEEREEVLDAIRAMELPVEEDGTIIISRKITPQRSQIRVCGETVTVKQVRELAALLIDIHGQHEHQSLLQTAKHREYLDAYCGEELAALLAQMAQTYGRYRKIEEKLSSFQMDEGARQREISLAEYEIREIEAAGLKTGEEEELEDKLRLMRHARNSHDGLMKVLEYTEGAEAGVLDGIGRAVHEMNAVADGDEKLSSIRDAFCAAEDLMRDAVRSVHDYMDDAAFDAEEYDRTEERLDQIRRLLVKYGRTEEDVLAYLEKRTAELKELTDLDASKEALSQEEASLKDKMDKLCDDIHKCRKKQAVILEKEITDMLLELNFLKVNFTISVEQGGEYSANGNDAVEFRISLNPGEKLRPLSEIASGGELSRIMLALKSVFAAKDEIGTMIFDEIDTGISGKTAWKVSEKMGQLSGDRQILCITHLPQIAAMADNHFLIEKQEIDGQTETTIRPLAEEEQAQELARMLGGDVITEAVLGNARDLKAQAEAVKHGGTR